MIGRIVEISDDRRHLLLYRGFLVVKESGAGNQELGRIPLDDISAVITSAHGLSYTNNLLVALANRGAPFVLCGANHNAVGMLLPVDGNFEQSRRIDAQCCATKPVKKKIWAAIVRVKIEQQAGVLVALGKPPMPLRSLIKKVRSGDPDNIEAQAARRYWGLLFGSDFRRNRDAPGINGLLNYGYTVFRAACARAVVSAGLHPSLGVHHSNAANAMRLVDDLIEPFRAIIDYKVYELIGKGKSEVTPETKRVLVRALYEDMETSSGVTPVCVCMQRLAVSLAQVYLGERESLDLPSPGLTISQAISFESG